MKLINLYPLAGILLFSSHAFSQTPLSNFHSSVDAQMTKILAHGKNCLDGLESNDLKALLKPSESVKAVLMMERGEKLQNSEELKRLTGQERMLIARLRLVSRACRDHDDHLTDLSRLGEGNPAPQVTPPKDLVDKMVQMTKSHEDMVKAIKRVSDASPEIAHFLVVHGALDAEPSSNVVRAADPGLTAPPAGESMKPPAGSGPVATVGTPQQQKRFNAANTTQDGRLTLEQAKAAKLGKMVQNWKDVAGADGTATLGNVVKFWDSN